MLHVPDKLLDPVQDVPPYLGEGLLQLRDLFLVPEPHGLEQLPQEPQYPQLPLTGSIKYINIMNIRDVRLGLSLKSPETVVGVAVVGAVELVSESVKA